MLKIYRNLLVTTLSLLAIIVLSNAASFAQSDDPDKPTRLANGEIIGSVNGNLQDDKTYYYALSVKPGALTLTVDMNPGKSPYGGTLEWHYLDSKFRKMKSDVYSAQGSTVRKVSDSKVTVKRKIILKLVVGGQFSYKLKFSGSALVP